MGGCIAMVNSNGEFIYNTLKNCTSLLGVYIVQFLLNIFILFNYILIFLLLLYLTIQLYYYLNILFLITIYIRVMDSYLFLI